jgi:hypothetical protein
VNFEIEPAQSLVVEKYAWLAEPGYLVRISLSFGHAKRYWPTMLAITSRYRPSTSLVNLRVAAPYQRELPQAGFAAFLESSWKISRSLNADDPIQE